MQMRHLVFKVLFPDTLDLLIGLVLPAGVIEIAFGVFVHQQIFQPRAFGIHQAAVARYVLFLDHGNFRVQLPSELVLVEVGLVHVVVHCLLLGGGQDVDV